MSISVIRDTPNKPVAAKLVQRSSQEYLMQFPSRLTGASS